jgi:hypothetical protein
LRYRRHGYTFRKIANLGCSYSTIAGTLRREDATISTTTFEHARDAEAAWSSAS